MTDEDNGIGTAHRGCRSTRKTVKGAVVQGGQFSRAHEKGQESPEEV
ncbi:hypothetical protein TIFTF001_028029 [Ficus carica]|uniref:Uncharacterized protein n=1 Tax=Ficus carica TaxID=3494 RepID=A0AA88DQ95_FICCA|nr:hypothetical protein TIFTF001_028029 [Ficus carica]